MDQPTTTPPDLDEFLGTQPKSKRSRLVKWGFIAVAVVLVLWLALRFFGGSGNDAAYVTQDVERGDLTVSVSATGNLQPTNQVDVGSELSGLVETVYVDNNDKVRKGEVLARLDTSRLQDAIRQSTASLQAAIASVGQAKATADQSQADLRRQQEVFRLSGGKVPSATELDSAKAAAARAVAAVRSAEADVARAQAQLSSDRTQLSKASIVSPVNGVVLSRKIEPGQTVAASFNAPVLFTIAEDLSAMRLEVKVDEADVGQVVKGQRAEFTVDAFPGRTFPATIERVDVGANASGSSSSSSTTTSANTVVAYTARLTVANPDLVLRPGMTATADIVTMEKQNVVLVPNAALRFKPNERANGQQGGLTSVLMARPGRPGGNGANREVTIGRGSRQTVYTLGADNKPQPIQVTVGDTNGSMTEVTGSNLRPGMKVITGRLSANATGNGSGGQRQGGQRQRPGGQGGQGGGAGGPNG